MYVVTLIICDCTLPPSSPLPPFPLLLQGSKVGCVFLDEFERCYASLAPSADVAAILSEPDRVNATRLEASTGMYLDVSGGGVPIG